MDCNNIGDHERHLKPERDLMKEASRMIGINLKESIDLSQMQVHDVSSEPFQDNIGHFYMKRSANLFAYVINEHGEREELKISFELKSTRRPPY